MSILSVDNISPIGSGTSVTVNSAATLVLTNANSTGVVTATSFVGNLTGTASGNPTLTNGSNDRIVTASGANALNGESTLTYGTAGQLNLTRASNSNVGLYVYHSDGNEVGHFGNIGSGNEGILVLKDGGTQTVKLAGSSGSDSYITSGNFGIGTNNPSVKTQIYVTNTTAYSASTIDANQFQLSITNAGANGVAGILLATEPSSGNGGHCGIRALSTGSGNSDLTFSTRGSSTSGERLRIGNAGQLGIAGANYGTSGQVLTSQGSGSAVQWATPAVTGGNMFIAKMNSGYITSNNTDGEIVFQNEVYDPDGRYNNSNGRFTPNVAGYYYIDASLQFSTNSANNLFESTIWKNGTEQFVNRMRNPASNSELHCKVSGIVSVNGSSDYISIAAWQNSGGNLTVNPGNGSYFTGFFLRSL